MAASEARKSEANMTKVEFCQFLVSNSFQNIGVIPSKNHRQKKVCMHAKQNTYYYSEPHLLLCVGRSYPRANVQSSGISLCQLHAKAHIIVNSRSMAWSKPAYFRCSSRGVAEFWTIHVCSDQVLMRENLLDGYRNRSLSIGGLWICIGALYAL